MTDEELAHYSRALDEIYLLRALLARQANIIEAHLSYKTFPKSRREVAAAQAEDMRAAARGDNEATLAASLTWSRKAALRSAGADECLTRSQWEEGR